MNDGIKKAVKIIWLLVIAATLVFIFVQSTLSKEESQKESDKVSDVLEEIIPPDTETGEFVQSNVRKIAHFVEFAVLGAETALYMIVYHRRVRSCVILLGFGLLMALFDETIQVFSNRGASVSDVWLDFAGFLSASAICYTVLAVLMIISKNVNKSRRKTLEEEGDK